MPVTPDIYDDDGRQAIWFNPTTHLVYMTEAKYFEFLQFCADAEPVFQVINLYKDDGTDEAEKKPP